VNIDRQKKIEILKRKSRRSNLVTKFSKYINITNESFLAQEDNRAFCTKVRERFNSEVPLKNIGGANYQENVTLSSVALNEIIQDIGLINCKAFLFIDNEYEVEAVRVNIIDVFNNISEILEKIGFFSMCNDFMLVGDNLDFGICVIRNEYFYEVYRWGI
jgi:hypothetical protein